MPGLYGTELELRKCGIPLHYFNNEALESRTVTLRFGTPYETLLGMICYSSANAERAAEFFVGLFESHSAAVTAYLSGFITRLAAETDLRTCELDILPDYRHTPMDFPRPSPAHMVLREFPGVCVVV